MTESPTTEQTESPMRRLLLNQIEILYALEELGWSGRPQKRMDAARTATRKVLGDEDT